MGLIGRYIFRTAFGAFVLVLVSLTAAIWLTQALRDLDLMTSQGQTILVFLGLTSLGIPILTLVITPVALVVAVAHLLHKLANDSEIIVMNGAGMRPWLLFRPFAAVAVVVTLMLAIVSVYVAPKGLRMMREGIIEARTDLLANIVQPGRFIAMERGLAFHLRERRPNGVLTGILLDDRRNEKERVTIVAEEGEILKTPKGAFLILANGSIQRHEATSRDPNIVRFDRYAFDLSQFSTTPTSIRRSARERFLWELIWFDPSESPTQDQRNQVWAELNDRLVGLFYPFTFVVIAYTFMGAPRTTRQSTTWSLLTMILTVTTVRLSGFIGMIMTVRIPALAAVQYVVVALTLSGCFFVISKGMILEPPAHVARAMNAVSAWFQRRTGAIMGPAQ